jgi:hypothetical protein
MCRAVASDAERIRLHLSRGAAPSIETNRGPSASCTASTFLRDSTGYAPTTETERPNKPPPRHPLRHRAARRCRARFVESERRMMDRVDESIPRMRVSIDGECRATGKRTETCILLREPVTPKACARVRMGLCGSRFAASFLRIAPSRTACAAMTRGWKVVRGRSWLSRRRCDPRSARLRDVDTSRRNASSPRHPYQGGPRPSTGHSRRWRRSARGLRIGLAQGREATRRYLRCRLESDRATSHL